MRRNVTPTGGYSVKQALASHPTLGALLGQHRQSQACLQIAKPLMGSALARSVRAGPLQEGRWVMLTASGAAAAKLRNWLPHILQALQARGMPVQAIEIRVRAESPV